MIFGNVASMPSEKIHNPRDNQRKTILDGFVGERSKIMDELSYVEGTRKPSDSHIRFILARQGRW